MLVNGAYGLLHAMNGESVGAFLPTLESVESSLEGDLWEFTYMPRSKYHVSGGQMAPNCLFKAAQLFSRGYRLTGDRRWAEAWARCIGWAIAWAFHTYGGRDEPEDVDLRGQAHATMSGRDQQADIPPMENTELLRAFRDILEIPPELIRPAWLDNLYLNSQTGLIQYPAARSTCRLLSSDYQRVVHLPAQSVGTMSHYRCELPFYSFENPYDQTLIATYQSIQTFYGDICFGGALAWVDEPHWLVLVPRAIGLGSREMEVRRVLLYNPLSVKRTSVVKAAFADGRSAERRAVVEPRGWVELTLE